MTSLLILASQILAAMEPNANSYNRDDFSAIVKKVGRDLCVTSILMTVQSNLVLLEQTVLTSSTTTDVNAQLDFLGRDVKTRLIYVWSRVALTETVLTNFSAMNVFVSLDGLETCVTKTLTIAREAQRIQAVLRIHAKMEDSALMILIITSANAYPDLPERTANMPLTSARVIHAKTEVVVAASA